MSSPIKTYPTKNTGVGSHAEVTGTDVGVNKRALDVNIANAGSIGDVNISAPTGPFMTTTVMVTDVATAYPAVALVDRASLAIHNKDPANTIYFGPSALVTADTVIGTTSGAEIGPNSGANFDLNDANVIYFVCETGKTALVKITEVAST